MRLKVKTATKYKNSEMKRQKCELKRNIFRIKSLSFEIKF